ncbi:hypothetical protein [Phytoactinopolyspora halotolerans]|uniref:Uncharacterized protein n=1 Tax=Phytoactinopolyspora halotolerans TaxID=1981512 RepID=A0A6L9SDL0_9ACTN|nr:hypothetical protein [Phytoactinopolyspora halotolerans]NEE02652.1 hypothetical protein [Phytoactinopolyspora halotolerans]
MARRVLGAGWKLLARRVLRARRRLLAGRERLLRLRMRKTRRWTVLRIPSRTVGAGVGVRLRSGRIRRLFRTVGLAGGVWLLRRLAG